MLFTRAGVDVWRQIRREKSIPNRKELNIHNGKPLKIGIQANSKNKAFDVFSTWTTLWASWYVLKYCSAGRVAGSVHSLNPVTYRRWWRDPSLSLNPEGGAGSRSAIYRPESNFRAWKRKGDEFASAKPTSGNCPLSKQGVYRMLALRGEVAMSSNMQAPHDVGAPRLDGSRTALNGSSARQNETGDFRSHKSDPCCIWGQFARMIGLRDSRQLRRVPLHFYLDRIFCLPILTKLSDYRMMYGCERDTNGVPKCLIASGGTYAWRRHTSGTDVTKGKSGRWIPGH